jgi:polyisoprenoid-binding protein YceI
MNKFIFLISAISFSLASYAGVYNIDPAHTYVTFEIDHYISTNRGRFDKKEGVVEFDAAAKTGRVELTIDPTSINTGLPAFNKHLQTKDFFNTEQYASAKFVADKFIFSGEKLTDIEGVLTLVGKSNPVKLRAIRFNCIQNNMLKREVCGGDFEGAISRSLWGIDWGLQRGYPDNVRLLIQVEAIQK